MSKLNKDILYLIFEEFQDDLKSLFSCLMVNKSWCKTAVPVLWRNPWSYKGNNYRIKSSLFTIIVYYLFDSIKEFITSKVIQLPSISNKSLSFDYLSYCRSINVITINRITSIGSTSAYDQFFIQEEFYLLLMRKCPELRYLDMRSIKHQLFYFPEAKARFESLCELKCDTSIDSSYFYGLSRILLALEKNAENINCLKVSFQELDDYQHLLFPNILLKFYNLKELVIGGDISFNNDQLNKLKMVVYKKLEIIKIDYNESINKLDFISSIVENGGECLKKILFKPNYDAREFNDYSLNFIRKIYQNCPLIEYLSISFSPTTEQFSEFEKLLKICKNLKSLLIVIHNSGKVETQRKFLKNGDNLLKLLIRSAPTNLREIRFYDDFKFSLPNLETFFKNWSGRPALSLTTNDPIYEGIQYKELINKYKSSGVIKDFKYVVFRGGVDYRL
ncbi:23076_t:CDS:2 [Rhizophagus irregularis]|nr:23076_t:CDS:2 [Rhizophagus irregularis]